LDLKSRLGAARRAMLVELQHAFVEGLPRERLCHHVRRVVGPEDFAQIELLGVHMVLDPEAADVYVPDLARTFAFRNGQCGTRVGIDHAAFFDSKVLHHALGADEFGGALHQRHELSFGGAECDVVLGAGPPFDEVAPYHEGAATRGLAGDSAAGPVRV